MIRIAGDQSLNEQANQLASLEESYQLKKISIDEYESKKVILIFECCLDWIISLIYVFMFYLTACCFVATCGLWVLLVTE